MVFGAVLLMFLSFMANLEQPYAFKANLQTNTLFSNNKLTQEMPNMDRKDDKRDEVLEMMKTEMQETKKEMKSLQQRLSETSAVLHKQCEQTDHMNSAFLAKVKEDGTYKLKFTHAYASSAWDEVSKAEHLIDGNRTTQYSAGSCLHTALDDNTPWVLLVLEKESEIHRVEILDRQDCCKGKMYGITLEMYDTYPRDDPSAMAKLCGGFSITYDPLVKVVCDHPVTGKYLWIKKAGAMLQGCEIEAFGYYTDSKFGIAIQSSTVTQANLASDGDRKTCSETENEANSDPWWQVDLLEETTVTGLMIVNRDDDKYTSLSDFQVSVFKNFPSVCLTSNEPVCVLYEGTVGQGETLTLTCDQPISGRYMRIKKLQGGTLSLCDVRVLKD